jgi:hypothetical protein
MKTIKIMVATMLLAVCIITASYAQTEKPIAERPMARK